MYQPLKADLPDWIPMDDDQEDQTAQATGSFVDLLKKRMMNRGPNTVDGQPVAMGGAGHGLSQGQIGQRAGAAANAELGAPPVMGATKSNAFGGGGMKSL